MRTHTRCLVWAVFAGSLGFAFVAVGQEPTASDPALTLLDPSSALLVELVGKLGLPGVLALLGLMAGRGVSSWQPTIRVVHVWDEPEQDSLRTLRDRLERLERGEP